LNKAPSTAAVWVNWALALLTIPGAIAVVVLQYVQILGTAGCSDRTCPHLGPSPVGFVIIQYGTPAVAVAAIVLSIFFAKRRFGFLVPVCAWTLLAVAVAVLIVTFRN
jgi:hypothetical protein